MLLKVKHKEVLALPFLNIIVLRYIYEKYKMNALEIDLMMHSIIEWNKKSIKDEYEVKWLEYLGSLLEKEESGKFKQRKESWKQHGIEWLKFHQIPRDVYKKFEQDLRKMLIK